MMNISVNDELISRFLSGDITNEEQRTLLDWLNESPENEKQLFILKDIFDGAAQERLYKEADTLEGWNRLQLLLKNRKKPSTPSKTNKVAHWTTQIRRYAAVLVIGILGTTAYFHYFAQKAHQHQPVVSTFHVKTEKGERATTTLPDGSIVRLNACSSLSYQSNYGENDRNVVFSGEAFFDIQTNANIPFAVKTFGLNIKAYGTTFNVKAYPDEDMIETTLVDGVVLIENDYNKHIITLEPNQVIAIPKLLVASNQENDPSTLTSDEQVLVKNEKPDLPKSVSRKEAVLRKNVKTEEYTSWKDDKWIIKSESLESLAKKIERRYDVSILIEDEASKKYVFSGTLRNYPLEQVLDIIRLNAPIQYVIKEKTVVIKEEKQRKQQYQKLIYTQ